MSYLVSRSRGAVIETGIAGLLITIGALTAAAWLLQIQTIVQLVPGLVPMVFNTALCFLLSGWALLLDGKRHALVARTLIAAFLLTLCAATFLELLMDRSLGVDMAFVHTWFDYGNTRPGRMAPNTALGFMLIGATLMLMDRVSNLRSAITVIVLTFMILAIGVTGIAGYLLAPDLLFGWARSARMALHTATGMILAAIGLWLSWSRSAWYGDKSYLPEDLKIRFLSAAILILMTMTAGLSGFVLLQKSLETTLKNRLEAVVQGRSPWFRALTVQASASASESLRLSGFMTQAAALLTDASDGSLPDKVALSAKVLLGDRHVGLTIENAEGRVQARFGNPAFDAPFTASLDAQGNTELLWKGRALLRTRHKLLVDGKHLGRVVLDQPMPELDMPLFNMAKLGSTAELSACVQRGQQLLCLPNGRNKAPFQVQTRPGNSPLPMQIALSGKSGIIHTLDYRGHNVIAAYGLLAPGLGFVAKQDTDEAYAPITKALSIGAPLILAVSGLGAALMYWQLSPLVRRMKRSETAASDAAVKVQTVMDAAGDGIVTIDQLGTIQSVNKATCRIFGYTSGLLEGRNVTLLMPADLRSAHEHGLARLVRGGQPVLLGTPNVQVEGQRADGSRFPLELTINAVSLSGQTLFVGIMRDITVRKEMEEQLSRRAQYDALTELPNRALFMDRLGTAVLRAQRSCHALAVMFIDLDGFKSINDAFGHDVGDQVLIQTARRLSAAVRKSDTVARLGGDEFTVILEELQQPHIDAQAVASKVIDAMRPPFVVSGREHCTTASVGLVVHAAGGTGSISDLLSRADEAMYAAKRSGKDSFCLVEAR